MHPAYLTSEVATSPHSNLASTQDTIAIMQQLVTESLPTPQIAQVAHTIALSLNPNSRSTEDICRKVFWWVKSHTRLVEDEWTLVDRLGHSREDLLYGPGKELLLSPAYLVLQDDAERQGDCDDFSTLAATLLIRLGVPRTNVYFITIATDAQAPMDFTHVYLKVRTPDINGQAFRWTDASAVPMMALDCSHGKYPGWETKDRYNEMLWQA